MVLGDLEAPALQEPRDALGAVRELVLLGYELKEVDSVKGEHNPVGRGNPDIVLEAVRVNFEKADPLCDLGVLVDISGERLFNQCLDAAAALAHLLHMLPEGLEGRCREHGQNAGHLEDST